MPTKDFIVFDSDSHVVEPPALWEKYLDPEYRTVGKHALWRHGCNRPIAQCQCARGVDCRNDGPERSRSIRCRARWPDHSIDCGGMASLSALLGTGHSLDQTGQARASRHNASKL